MSEKAQLMLYEFMLATIIFVGIFIVFIYYYNENISNAEIYLMKNALINSAVLASDILLNTQGIPKNWNKDNVNVIGIADEANILNEQKLEELKLMDYEKIKQKLFFGNYNFSIMFKGKNIDLNIGNQILGEEKIVIERNVLYKGESINVRINVWE